MENVFEQLGLGVEQAVGAGDTAEVAAQQRVGEFSQFATKLKLIGLGKLVDGVDSPLRELHVRSRFYIYEKLTKGMGLSKEQALLHMCGDGAVTVVDRKFTYANYIPYIHVDELMDYLLYYTNEFFQDEDILLKALTYHPEIQYYLDDKLSRMEIVRSQKFEDGYQPEFAVIFQFDW